MNTNILRNLLASLVLAPMMANAATLLDDHFTDGNRTSQELPNSAAYWIFGRTSDNLVESSNQLNWTTAATTGVIGHFTDSGTIPIPSGESLTLEFTAKFSGVNNVDYGIRFGLFNSGGNRITADSNTLPNNGFSSYAGYFGAININNDAAGKAVIYKRFADATNEPNQLFTLANVSNSGPVSSLKFGNGVVLDDGISYTGSLSLVNKGTYLEITLTLAGQTISITETFLNGAYSEFDTFAIYNNGATSSISFTNIKVTGIPEPGAPLMVLGTVGMFLLFRRTARKKSPDLGETPTA